MLLVTVTSPLPLKAAVPTTSQLDSASVILVALRRSTAAKGVPPVALIVIFVPLAKAIWLIVGVGFDATPSVPSSVRFAVFHLRPAPGIVGTILVKELE